MLLINVLLNGLAFERAYFNSAELFLRVYNWEGLLSIYGGRAYNKVFTVCWSTGYCLKERSVFLILILRMFQNPIFLTGTLR